MILFRFRLISTNMYHLNLLSFTLGLYLCFNWGFLWNLLLSFFFKLYDWENLFSDWIIKLALLNGCLNLMLVRGWAGWTCPFLLDHRQLSLSLRINVVCGRWLRKLLFLSAWINLCDVEQLLAAGTTTRFILPLFGLSDFEKESFIFFHGLEPLLSLLIHYLKFVLLCVWSDLGWAARLHICLYLLPIIAVLFQGYTYK